jgi:hypothetical protein
MSAMDGDTDILRSDYDSPWKEALARRFPEFLALLFPQVHAGIDWTRGHDFLDKELQQIAPDAESERRHADQLARVHARDGRETWVLIHVEVQGETETDFPARMFVYNYRLRDRYAVPVVSLAVFTDTVAGYRPDCHRDARWGCRVVFRFPTAKLLDWSAPRRWRMLENSDNVFALVVMAQIRARASRDPEERRAWKFRLVRLMYERGHERAIILELLRIIDWMIRLPAGLEKAFWRDAHQLEEATKMAYVMSIERIGIEKGRQQGEALVLLRQIELKFGAEVAATHRGRIEQADAGTLLLWSERILTARQADEIFVDPA